MTRSWKNPVGIRKWDKPSSFFSVMNVTAVQTTKPLLVLRIRALSQHFPKSAVSQLMLFFDFGYAFER